MTDLRSAARALGGEVVGRKIVCPGPNHSWRDRSLILFDASAPGGFILHSHAGDDFRLCRDFVRERLGISAQVSPKLIRAPILPDNVGLEPASDHTALALRMWREAQPAVGSPVEVYFASRGLTLTDDAHEVIRYAPNMPFAGTGTPGMVALVRNVLTDEPQAIHRTALPLGGQKAEVNGRNWLALGSIRG